MGKGLGAVMMVGRGMGRVDGMKWGGCVRRGGERQVDIYTYTCARAYTYIYIYISLYGSTPVDGSTSPKIELTSGRGG